MVTNCGFSGSSELEKMAENKVFFALDIGTKSRDLAERQQIMQDAINSVQDSSYRQQILNAVYFSAGIWPSPEEIKDRFNGIAQLEKIIQSSLSSENPLFKKIAAIGECGIDHHWNPSGVDHRSQQDFDSSIIEGEKELFCMQLELAKKLNFPVIVHSRDAFEDTLECLDKINWHNGIIHCYSYGKTEAKEFLDYGWYISFSGSVTYTKKRCMNEMEELIKSIPDDRILVETDSPYLAPVPFRGKVNSPSLIKNTYDFIAKIKGISSEELSALVDKNISKLFTITKPDCKEN